MTELEKNEMPRRIFVIAPLGDDAEMACRVLRNHDFEARPFKEINDGVAALDLELGALLITEEAVKRDNMQALREWLTRQPPWSDLPIVVMTFRRERLLSSEELIRLISPNGMISMIERPFRVDTFLSVVRMAINARRRQFQVRRLLNMLQQGVSTLEGEKEIRERFVLALGHDLRNPLSAAKIAAQLLARHPDEADLILKTADRIVRSVDRADNMIRDLLDANRIRAGEKLPLHRSQCRLDLLMADAVSDLISLHGSRFVLETPLKVEGFWDCESLRRVVENLCTNAVKYGDQDWPITVCLRDRPGEIEISVHNYGRPLSPEEASTLFLPFRRSISAVAGNQKGWGLGLTLVRGVAEAHGGTAEVKSESGVGTTFRVVLPKVMS